MCILTITSRARLVVHLDDSLVVTVSGDTAIDVLPQVQETAQTIEGKMDTPPFTDGHAKANIESSPALPLDVPFEAFEHTPMASATVDVVVVPGSKSASASSTGRRPSMLGVDDAIDTHQMTSAGPDVITSLTMQPTALHFVDACVQYPEVSAAFEFNRLFDRTLRGSTYLDSLLFHFSLSLSLSLSRRCAVMCLAQQDDLV